jgi:Na+-translocating ferredoxin:NAD+ oxidoreductase subunit G
MKNMLKLGVALALYATAACVGLAFVYAGTQRVIAERQKADLEAALTDLFPAADDFKEMSGTLSSPDASVEFKNEYLIQAKGETIGVAVRAVGASYGGPITVLAGVGVDQRIGGVKVLENKDTPGLGANAASPTYFVDRSARLTFYGQFAGKALSDAFEVKADIAAITASTITSKAVAGAVKAAGQAAGTWLTANTASTGGSK